MAKPYEIGEMSFTNLNDLGLYYASDFDACLDDIYNNTKKLLKFIKSHDKAKAIEVTKILHDVKYENNVGTFIIFTLLDDKKVYINGIEYTLRKLTETLALYGYEHKAIMSFIEDAGVTRTFAKMEPENPLIKDIFYIESNILDEFVFNYFVNFFKFDNVKTLQGLISNIFIYEDERFRRAWKILNNDEFQIILAHKVGFKEVYHMRKFKMPVFTALRLLKGEFNEKDLKKIVENSYFWWLANNLDKYKFKGDAKEILKEITLLKDKKPDSMEYDDYINASELMYNLYLEFIDAYQRGKILVNPKEDESMFIPDKIYCHTYICADYIKDNPVKLKDPDDPESTSDLMKPDQEKIETRKAKKAKKLIRKLNRYQNFNVFFGCLFGITGVGIYLLAKFNLFELTEEIKTIYFILAVAGLAGSAISWVVTKICRHFTEGYIDEYIYYNELNQKANRGDLDVDHLKVYNDLKNDAPKFKKKYKKNHYVIMLIGCIFSSLSVSAGTVFIVAALNKFGILNAKADVGILALLIGPIFAFVSSPFMKKKASLTSILVFLVSCGSVMLFALM